MKNLIKNIINKLIVSTGYSLINNNQKIVELNNNDKKLINLAQTYSMTPQIRIFNLLQSLRYLKNKKIDGDYVECGVWKGGNIILFKKFIEDEDENSKKKIYAFDTYEGMTEPDKNDYDISSNIPADILLKGDKAKRTNIWGICNLENVKKKYKRD